MQLEDRRVFSHGIGHFDVFSGQQPFVARDVANNLDGGVSSCVLLDEEADA